MKKFSLRRALPVVLGGVVTCCAFFLLLGGYSRVFAQNVPVTLSPLPVFQSWDQLGRPNAFGCVFTYQNNSTTPLATYTDVTGSTQNSNPVILSAGGAANIWIQAGQAYSFRVKLSGGTNCVSGQTIYTVNGIGGGAVQLSVTIPSSSTPLFPVSAQTELFTFTLTSNATSQPLTFVGVTPPATIFFQIIQDGSGGHTFSWPTNTVGGCTVGSAANQVTTQEFVYNGTNATAVGPCVIGNGPALDTGTINISGNTVASGTSTASQFISTIATGTPPLVVSSTSQVANLNASQLEGKTWEAPGTIGSTTPSTGVFTTETVNTSLTLNGGTPQTGIQGTDTKIMTAGTIGGSTGAALCKDANGGATTSGCGQVSQINYGQNSSVCSTTNSAGNTCATVVSWNSSFADTSYYAVCSGVSASGNPYIADINTFNLNNITVTISNGTASSATVSTYAKLQCIGIHP